MSDTAPWIGGILMGFLALFGLVLAAGAVDGPFQAFGLALFVFGVLAIFGLIARATRLPLPESDRPAQQETAGES
jgi:hypothetical protein